ncbi:MAG: hypothetical protein AAF958_01665 [Planctomycetota bacterium]
MAKRTINRLDKAAEVEAADKVAAEKKATKKKATKKKATKRKTKVAADVRLKLYWGVFSQNSKRVAVFEHDQKKEALARAEELSKGGKSPHFVQKVKEEIKVE